MPESKATDNGQALFRDRLSCTRIVARIPGEYRLCGVFASS
jgi:hypothetical protein